MGRAVSVRASSVAMDVSSSTAQVSRRTASSNTKRWSTALDYSSYDLSSNRQSTTGVRDSLYRGRTTAPTYTDALIKCSQRFRERSMSPPPAVQPEKISPYHCNMDYYRGKVKPVYEKEPYFKVVTHDVSCIINIFQFSSVWQDFVRNIPLSETNVYDMNNLSRLKKRFNSIVQDKWGSSH